MRSKKEAMKEVGEVFDCKIIIQKLTTATNDNGFQEEVWQDWKSVWSNKKNLYGREFWTAKAVQAETTTKFKIRYLKELDSTKNEEGISTTKKFRIKCGNSVFNITFIDNIKHQNRFMEIKAKEVF